MNRIARSHRAIPATISSVVRGLRIKCEALITPAHARRNGTDKSGFSNDIVSFASDGGARAARESCTGVGGDGRMAAKFCKSIISRSAPRALIDSWDLE